MENRKTENSANCVSKQSVEKTHLNIFSPVVFGSAILVCLIPLFLFLFWMLTQNKEMNKKTESFKRVSQFAVKTYERRKEKNIFLRKHLNASSKVLNEYFSQKTFIQKELEQIEELSKDPLFLTQNELKNRLQYLKNKNTLSFQPEFLNQKGKISEYIEKQINPVELHLTDFNDLFSFIEELQVEGIQNPFPKPFYIINSISLKKQTDSTFQMSMDLIRQDFKSQGINQ